MKSSTRPSLARLRKSLRTKRTENLAKSRLFRKSKRCTRKSVESSEVRSLRSRTSTRSYLLPELKIS